MTIWDVLKINRTDNIPAIRMAYVKGLCEINPEEFSIPDFLAAHEAYQRALLYARSGTDPDYEIPEDRNSLRITRGVIAYMEPIVRLRELALPDTAKTGTPPDVIKHLSDIVFFYTMMMALQDDFYSRIEVENWKELLQSDILRNPLILRYLRLPLLASVAAEPLLPQNVWLYLDVVFQWSNPNIGVPKDYSEEMRILKTETDPRWDLSFSRFRLIKKLPERPKERERVLHPIKWEYGKVKRASAFNTDFEMYAAYRRFCRDAIIDGNASDAEKWFIRAANVFDGDSDLFVIFYDFIKGLRSKGEYSMTQEMHLGIVARLLDFYPEHLGFLISKADYYFDNKQYDQAIEEYRKLEVQFPDSLMVLYAMARAYQASGRDTDSSKILKLIEKRYKSVQERLNSGRSHSLDASSMKVIREENENVMRLISGKGKPR
ncbi:MAG: tetratricopeptide repeat protein [Clostridiaceae bacterium]|jgi:tetratricopeptide (TPR) repeat protein|nr:tetratricopeptide repeat protein [Clostridiaceae bacterium]